MRASYVCRWCHSTPASYIAPIAVDAVMRVVDPVKDTNVNLKDIKIVKKLGYATRQFGVLIF